MVAKTNVHNNNIQSLQHTVECLEKEQNCYQNEVEKYITMLQLQQKQKQIVGEDPAEDPAIDTDIVVGSSFDVHDAITSKKPHVLNNDNTNLCFNLMKSAQSLLHIQKMLSIQQNKLYEKEKAEMQLTINALQKEKDQLLLAEQRKQEEQLHQPFHQVSTSDTECSINSESFEALKKENSQLHMKLNALKRERNIIQCYIKDAYAYEEYQWKQQTNRHSMSNEQEENDRSDNVNEQQLQIALKAITHEKDRYQQQYQQMKAQYQDLLRRQRKSNKKRDEVEKHEKQTITISRSPQQGEKAVTVQEEQQDQEQQEQQKKEHFNLDGKNNNDEGHNSNSKNIEKEETVKLDEGWLLGDGNQEILIMDSCDRDIGCFGGGYSTTNIEMVVQLTNKS